MEREEVEKLSPARKIRVRRQSEYLQQQRRRVEVVRGDDPVPMALTRGRHRKRIALFGSPQSVDRVIALDRNAGQVRELLQMILLLRGGPARLARIDRKRAKHLALG